MSFVSDLRFVRQQLFLPQGTFAQRMRIPKERYIEIEEQNAQPTEEEIQKFKNFCTRHKIPVKLDY